MSDKKIKKSFTNQSFKTGAYSSAVTVVVIAIIVLVNLVAAKMDLKTDISSGSLYSLSDEAKEILKKTDANITIYYMVEDGQENDYIQKALEPFERISDKVKVEKKNPVLYPTFAMEYTDEAVSQNDVIVVNEDSGRGKFISNQDLYVVSADSYSGTYSYSLDVEGQVTSAVQFVTSADLIKMYVLSGHDEMELGSAARSMIEKMNVDIEDLSLADGKIPSDCEVLFMNAPAGDLLPEEVKLIKKYLDDGGKAVINTMYSGSEQKNMAELLEYYGVSLEPGFVYDAMQGYYYTYPNYLVPEINQESELTAELKGVIVPGAQGIHISEDIRGSVKVTSILDTTEESYAKADPEANTMKKEKGDASGPFSVAAAIEETVGDKETKIALFTTPFTFQDAYVSMVQLGNGTLLTNSISWMADTETEQVSISAKSLSESSVTLPGSSMVMWTVLVVVILPLAILIGGFVVWMRRRKS